MHVYLVIMVHIMNATKAAGCVFDNIRFSVPISA